MTNRLFDTNIEILQYLGYITHDKNGTLTDTASTVCARLSAENIALSSFGVMCGTFAGKYWNEAKRANVANYSTSQDETESESRNAGWTFDEPDIFDGDF